VPGDVSPLPGSGLKAPAVPQSADSTRAAARGSAPADPSLAKVVGTTLRLWLRRRVLRVSDGASVGALRWASVSIVILLVAGGGAALALGLSGSHRASAGPHSSPRPAAAVRAAQARAMAAEHAAATWIAGQVAAGAGVGCDPAMCADLQSAGLPAAQAVVIEAGSGLPGIGGLLVVTAAIRDQDGPELAAQASRVIASFGTGAALVQVRSTTTGTAAAYQAALRQAIAASRTAGRALARDGRLRLYGVSRQQLLSGLVDPRLLVVLRRMLAAYPVYVTGFGDAGPGAGWPAQLRSVHLDGLVRGTGKHRVSDLSGVLRLLRGQRAPYRAILRAGQAGGRVTLTVEFPAPSPA
jgi:hypothetical protein